MDRIKDIKEMLEYCEKTGREGSDYYRDCAYLLAKLEEAKAIMRIIQDSSSVHWINGNQCWLAGTGPFDTMDKFLKE